MSIGISASQLTAFQYYGGLKMKPLQDAHAQRPSNCEWLMVSQENSPNVANIVNANRWIRIKNLPRPAEKSEQVTLYYRPASPTPPLN